MPVKRAALLLMLSHLSSCADVPPSVNAQDGRVWEHRCPAPGTTVRTSNNTTITYAGTAQPGTCRLANGRLAVAGFWSVSPGPDAEVIQQWIDPLFPAAAGRRSTGHSVSRTIRSQDTYMFMREARVLGFETITVPAGRFDAVVIEWITAGTGNNVSRVRERRWLDTQTGALVQLESRIIAGIGPENAWQAVRLTLPANESSVLGGGPTSSSRNRQGR